MPVDEFGASFSGDTLEDVLAHMIALPATIGISASSEWFMDNVFHLRISEFEVLAEIFRDHWQGGKIVGETVIPFKGDPLATGQGVIKGGIRTERLIVAPAFHSIGLGLLQGIAEVAA